MANWVKSTKDQYVNIDKFDVIKIKLDFARNRFDVVAYKMTDKIEQPLSEGFYKYEEAKGWLDCLIKGVPYFGTRADEFKAKTDELSRKVEILEDGTKLVEYAVYLCVWRILLFVLKYGEYTDFSSQESCEGWYFEEDNHNCYTFNLDFFKEMKYIENALDYPALLEKGAKDRLMWERFY